VSARRNVAFVMDFDEGQNKYDILRFYRGYARNKKQMYFIQKHKFGQICQNRA